MSPGLLETRVILVPLLVAGFFLGYKLCFKIHQKKMVWLLFYTRVSKPRSTRNHTLLCRPKWKYQNRKLAGLLYGHSFCWCIVHVTSTFSKYGQQLQWLTTLCLLSMIILLSCKMIGRKGKLSDSKNNGKKY